MPIEGYLQHYNEEIPNIKNKLKILPNFSNEYQIKQKIVKNQNLNYYLQVILVNHKI